MFLPAKIKYGDIYVWKYDKLIKACFIFSTTKKRTYIVLNDSKTNSQINDRINGWIQVGWNVKIGLPPSPLKLIDGEFKEINHKKGNI